jgi:hypothetical protein
LGIKPLFFIEKLARKAFEDQKQTDNLIFHLVIVKRREWKEFKGNEMFWGGLSVKN